MLPEHEALTQRDINSAEREMREHTIRFQRRIADVRENRDGNE